MRREEFTVESANPRMQKIAILYDASQAVLSTFDLDEVLSRILAIVRDYFHLGNCAVLLREPDSNDLLIRSSFGRADAAVRIPWGQGITGAAAKLRRPVYVPDVSKDSRYLQGSPSTRSELAIPLMVRDEVVGVLDLQSDKLDHFDKETVDLALLFSTQASIALQNAKLYSLEQRRAAELRAINALARQTTSVLDVQELLPKACSLIIQAFPVDHVTVMMLESGRLVKRAHHGKLREILPTGNELPPGAGLSAQALATGKSVIVDNVQLANGYVAGLEGTVSEMCLPLVAHGQTLGVLVLDSARASAFRSPDTEALHSVADICAIAIQNAHSFERVQQMAEIDGLTGIYNRRHLERRLVAEFDRMARYEHGMAVLMVDIDHFKRVNDEFGHLLGDEVLRHISVLFTQNLRKLDILCRYGGEEFAILLPETTGENAKKVAEKLRRKIESHNFTGVPRPVTVSIGHADYPAHGTTRDELIKAADEALYAAKQAGRNRVVSHGTPAMSAKAAPVE